VEALKIKTIQRKSWALGYFSLYTSESGSFFIGCYVLSGELVYASNDKLSASYFEGAKLLPEN